MWKSKDGKKPGGGGPGGEAGGRVVVGEDEDVKRLSRPSYDDSQQRMGAVLSLSHSWGGDLRMTIDWQATHNASYENLACVGGLECNSQEGRRGQSGRGPTEGEIEDR